MSPDRIRPGSARNPGAGPEPADQAAEPPEALHLEAPIEPLGGQEAAAAEEGFQATPPEASRGPTSASAATAPEAGAPGGDEDDAVSVPLAPRGHGRFRRLYYGETSFDFVRRKRIWFTLSALVILAGVISLGVRGLDLSIDFVGGTSWTVESPTLSVTATQSALVGAGLNGATVVVLGSGSNRTIEVEAKLPKGQSSAAHQQQANSIADVLARISHKSSPNDVSIESVGPSWGGQITHKAIIALIVFFILISIYISVFFEWRMALGAIIAVFHDILVTVGIYSLTGFLVTPDTVVAILTILGYSLYDTIVVFDRVRDNVRNLTVRDRLTFTDMVNLSMNQTLARSINTSLVAIMPILAVLVLGAEVLGATTLQYFGLALLVGLTSGAYSSIFIASPLVAILKEREPRYRQLRERLELRGGSRWLLSAADVARGFGQEDVALTRSVPTRRAGRIQPGSAGAPAADGSRNGDEARSSRPSSPRPQSRRPAARSRRRGGRR